MPGPRLLAPFLLAAAAVAGVALATSALDAPGRADPLPIPSPAPGDVTAAFTSEADLREFARAAYHDLSREDWPALLRSLLPGDYGADPCAPGTLAARAAAGVRRAALDIEAALAAGDALHAQRVALPQPEWAVAAVELGDGEAWITRRARAYGRAVAPPVVRRDRWTVANGEWWLDPASLAPDGAEDAPAGGCAPADDGAVRASPESAFARPLPSGATVEAQTGGAALAITLTAGERGGGPPAPHGYEYAEFTARVESRDGAQLGAPLAFRSATYDGWLLGGAIPVSTAICPGTEDSGVTCHLTRGRALVAAHDPAPRIAWTPAARPGERASGAAWWRLPTLIRDGKPAVRDLSADAPLPLQGAGGPEAQAGVPSGVWATDFTRAAVDLAQIAGEGATRAGGSALVLAGADATPSVYDSAAEAGAWLADAEPVLAVEAGGAARAYPLRLLLWHPVVNDELGGEPVLVTFSPLTNTAAAYERRTGVAAPEFRATGALRFRNALLYDAPTESWWQQATGGALAGDLAGLRLAPLPGVVLSWAVFRAAYPNGDALSINAGFAGDFDFNPYFDVDFSPPDQLRGADLDPRLNAHARVLGLRAGGAALAFPYADLALDGAAHADLGGEPVVVFWRSGTASALSSIDIASGRDVGSAAAYDPRIDGAALTFTAEGAAFLDAQTGSRWDLTGRAVSGPLEGRRLRPMPEQTTSFWFAWAALHPETDVYRSARRAS